MSKTRNIFIIEDDESVQILYKKFFILLEYNVIGIAVNGEEAIKMFKSFPRKPDIIIVDNYMPIKDGIETMLEILKLDNNSKIVFTSGDKSLKKRALSAGASYFLEKPFSLLKLANIFNYIFNDAVLPYI
ncbi:MAG: response regulator [Promethearchaeota archaeon]